MLPKDFENHLGRLPFGTSPSRPWVAEGQGLSRSFDDENRSSETGEKTRHCHTGKDSEEEKNLIKSLCLPFRNSGSHTKARFPDIVRFCNGYFSSTSLASENEPFTRDISIASYFMICCTYKILALRGWSRGKKWLLNRFFMHAA
mgnify:CR=1 FL=1